MIQEHRVRVLALSLVCFLAGCVSARHTPPPEAPSQTAPVAAPLAATAVLVPTQPLSTGKAPAPPAPPAARETAPPEPPADRVAGFLPQGLVVLQISNATLLVKRSTATPPASLFEESIALSKLRRQLKIRPGIPRGTAEKTGLHDGTASLIFAGPLPAAEAAGAISAALSLDGIQRVRAVLAP